LIGVLFLNPLIGVALGAASGAVGGLLMDYGINDAFMKELAASLKPGDAALFVLIQNMTADKVLKEIQGAGGTLLKTSLDDTKEKVLREAQRAKRPARHCGGHANADRTTGWKSFDFVPPSTRTGGRCCHGPDEAVILIGEIA
jgi:hypothetical protein